jgi:hypothetical protein
MTDLSGVSAYMQLLPDPPRPYIITMDELMASYSVTSQKEAADRKVVSDFIAPSGDDLRPKLFEWANKGFPTIYPLRTISVTPPLPCSDGTERNTIQYAEFIMNSTITQCITKLQDKMPGLELTFSHSATNMTLHVSRGS